MKINNIMTVVSANDGIDINLPPSVAGERGGENISQQQEELVKRCVEMLGAVNISHRKGDDDADLGDCI